MMYQIEKRELSLLINYIKIIRSTESDEEYTSRIKQVFPLIWLMRPEKECKKRKRNYSKRYKKYEAITIDQTKKAFEIFKQRLLSHELSSHPIIKKRVCRINAILEFREYNNDENDICSICGDYKTFHKPYLFPTYANGLFFEVQQLFFDVFDLGGKDLVKYFFTLRRMIADIPNNKKEEIIDATIFSRAFFKLQKLDSLISLNNKYKIPPWVAYEILYSIFWSLDSKVSWDYLRKKKLKYNNTPALSIAAHRLKIHDLRFNIKNIDKLEENLFTEDDIANLIKRELIGSTNFLDSKPIEISSLLDELSPELRLKLKFNGMIYTRQQIDRILDVVLNDVIKRSGIEFEEIVSPISMELFFDSKVEKIFYLKVAWTQNLIEIFKLHRKFQEKVDDSIGEFKHIEIFAFLERLFDCEINYPVDDSKRFTELNYKGIKANAKKYLNAIGLEDVLYSFFIKEETGYRVALKSTFIDLSKMPIIKLKPLVSELQNMNHYQWQYKGQILNILKK